MMMAMLAAGRIPVLTDNLRTPDEHNPRGYLEFEAVKKTASDPSWLAEAEGKAVKMVYLLLYDLPMDRQYKVIFMRRRLDEVLASQEAMLGTKDTPGVHLSQEQLRTRFAQHVSRVRTWIDQQLNFAVIDVDFQEVLGNPQAVAIRLDKFLGPGLDVAAMSAVPDQTLYRHRA
jgi:hypothetical protein